MNKKDSTTSIRCELEQQKLEDAIRELCEEKIVFNQFLGFKMPEFFYDKAEIIFDMRPELIGHYMHKRLHGGVVSTALDAIGGLALMCAIAKQHEGESALEIMQRFKPMATIDLRVDYLRPGGGPHFKAVGTVSRLGRRIGATHSVLLDAEGAELATCSAVYMVS